jgi:hypothetical protein
VTARVTYQQDPPAKVSARKPLTRCCVTVVTLVISGLLQFGVLCAGALRPLSEGVVFISDPESTVRSRKVISTGAATASVPLLRPVAALSQRPEEVADHSLIPRARSRVALAR